MVLTTTDTGLVWIDADKNGFFLGWVLDTTCCNPYNPSNRSVWGEIGVGSAKSGILQRTIATRECPNAIVFDLPIRE